MCVCDMCIQVYEGEGAVEGEDGAGEEVVEGDEGEEAGGEEEEEA